MIAAWHEEKNVEGVFNFLLGEGIEFDIDKSYMKGHTAFLVEVGQRNRIANKIARKFGRFELECREIEVTEEEQKQIDANKNALAEKEKAYKEKKQKLKELFRSKDEDEGNENE